MRLSRRFHLPPRDVGVRLMRLRSSRPQMLLTNQKVSPGMAIPGLGCMAELLPRVRFRAQKQCSIRTVKPSNDTSLPTPEAVMPEQFVHDVLLVEAMLPNSSNR